MLVPAIAGCLLVLSGAPASAGTVAAEPSEASVRLAALAVRGAGGAASRVLAQGAEAAGEAIGGAAASITLPAAPTAKPARTSAAAVAALPVPSWRWNGWVSGAAGPETEDETFATFRGEPLGIVGVWSDTSVSAQTEMRNVGAYPSFQGEMDIAVGGLVRGETWEQAAAGQFVDRWTTAIRNIRFHRAGKGTTYIRIAHEFNGDWMAWGVDSKNVEAFKKGYRLYASIVRKEFPEARLTFSPNSGNHTDVSIDAMWPGDDVVDVIGPDYYDWDDDVSTAATWKLETNSWLVPKVTPTGLAAWRQYAERKGKPIAMPEWGLPMGDDPVWIKNVHAYMAQYAAPRGGGDVAGRFVYDVYFNAEAKFKLTSGSNPKAGAMYASLDWGK